jgi:hypothetical protein
VEIKSGRHGNGSEKHPPPRDDDRSGTGPLIKRERKIAAVIPTIAWWRR